MDTAICPFVIKRPNRCLNCDNQLVLVSSEVQFTEIDDEGHPINTKTNYTNSLCCPICQSKYHVWIDEANMIIRPAFGDTNIRIVDRDPNATQTSPFNSENTLD
mgnify:CR=1 FL=1